MFRTRPTGKKRVPPAAYLVLAVLFALRCSVAWAAADVSSAGPAELARAAPPPARTHAVTLAAVRPAPARCEAANDPPAPPSSSQLIALRWSTPAAIRRGQANRAMTGAPALPPPARGPPLETA
jgi:hypothetical protein